MATKVKEDIITSYHKLTANYYNTLPSKTINTRWFYWGYVRKIIDKKCIAKYTHSCRYFK